MKPRPKASIRKGRAQKQGGKSRAKKLSPEARSVIASLGGIAKNRKRKATQAMSDGGKKAAKNMSALERSARAKQAALARWGRK